MIKSKIVKSINIEKNKKNIRNDFNEYSTINVITTSNISTTVFSHNKYREYEFRDNEKNESFHSYKGYRDEYRNKRNSILIYPYFNILSSRDYMKLKILLFFNYYYSYFLHNNLCKICYDNNYYPSYANILEKKIYMSNWKKKYLPIIKEDEEEDVLYYVK